MASASTTSHICKHLAIIMRDDYSKFPTDVLGATFLLEARSSILCLPGHTLTQVATDAIQLRARLLGFIIQEASFAYHAFEHKKTKARFYQIACSITMVVRKHGTSSNHTMELLVQVGRTSRGGGVVCGDHLKKMAEDTDAQWRSKSMTSEEAEDELIEPCFTATEAKRCNEMSGMEVLAMAAAGQKCMEL